MPVAPPIRDPNEAEGMLPFGGADAETADLESRAVPAITREAGVQAAENPQPAETAPSYGPPAEGQQPPTQPFIPQKEAHHAHMRALDESSNAMRQAAAANADALGNLSVEDPDFYKKVLKYTGQHSALHTAHGEIEQAKAEEKLANPWGTIGNHPGIGGKIGHAFGVLGNVAGNAILGKENMSGIPGSQAALEKEKMGGAAEQAEAAKESAEGAQTAKTQAEVPVEEAKVPAVEAGTEHTRQETENLKNPPLKTVQEQYSAAVADAEKRNVDPNSDPKVKQLADTITSLQKQSAEKEDKLEQQYNDAIESGDHEKAQRILKVMEDVAKAKQPPQQPPQAIVIEPGGVVANAKPGMTLPEGTQTPAGFATMGRPTTQMRNVNAQAGIAVEGIPGVVSEIDKLKDQLGPVSGRWNEFMQGKVGMENREMAGLRADLLMVASAVALAHARGRLPENLRQEFDNAINAPKQDPENLKAVLNHILPWMQRMQSMTDVTGAGNGGGGVAQKFTSNGKVYNIPADQVAAFKKDHPDAR